MVKAIRQDGTTSRKLIPHNGFHQAALVPTGAETHAGEDVGVYAVGPGAHLLTGTIEQSVIFHVMNHAGNLLGKATKQLEK